MVVGTITITTCSGETSIPVELLGKGPRPGTAWVQALEGRQPFTRISHGGPYQDDTAVIPLSCVRDVHLEADPEEKPEGEREEEQAETHEDIVSIPVTPDLAPDWFLEIEYEDRTYIE
jgi:hypothetical protein